MINDDSSPYRVVLNWPVEEIPQSYGTYSRERIFRIEHNRIVILFSYKGQEWFAPVTTIEAQKWVEIPFGENPNTRCQCPLFIIRRIPFFFVINRSQCSQIWDRSQLFWPTNDHKLITDRDRSLFPNRSFMGNRPILWGLLGEILICPVESVREMATRWTGSKVHIFIPFKSPLVYALARTNNIINLSHQFSNATS